MIAIAVLLLGVPKIQSAPSVPLAEVAIDDGRIIIVDAVTYGTNHVVGDRSEFAERFGPWITKPVRDFFTSESPQSSIRSAPDTLVVWLTALNANSRTNVDCQRLRVEFVDEQGDVWGTTTSSWHAYDNNFYRIGHVFEAYPRAAKELTFRITPRRSTNSYSVTIPNPHVVIAAKWAGQSLPASTITNGLELVLHDLQIRTNGGPTKSWQTPAKYWQPEWKFLSGGEPVEGWREPEWTATDPLGNRGQFLGVRQPVIRYAVKLVPEATNASATSVAAMLPSASISAGAANTLWFRTNRIEGAEVVSIGLMTSVMNHFMEGEYQAVPVLPIGPTQGGAPTGWVSAGKRVSPLKVITQLGHYSDRPTVYLRCTDAAVAEQLGVRVRDDQGRIWPTTRERGGGADGIIPFMLDVPSSVSHVVPEIVFLKPLEAEFTVLTPTLKP